MILKNHLCEYTEQNFLELLHEINRANEDEEDEILVPLLEHFESITEHPAGTDLIYWAASDELSKPEQILEIIREWRIANGKDGFKPS